MLTLRPLRQDDIPAIKAWPSYPRAFAMLDYALRDGGWLDEYSGKEGTEILVAEEDREVVGFSILSRRSPACTEFRIALHPLQLGRGLGHRVARGTLRHAFSDAAIRSVYLIVRKNNPRAERLYASLGFRHCGECTEPVHGEPVEFRQMEIDRETFEGREGS